MEIASPYGNFQKKNRRLNNLKSFSFFDSINYYWGLVVCGELIAVKPRSTGARVLTLLFSCFAIALTTNYTGNIIASLVSEREFKPVSGLKDPELVQKNVKVAAVRGTMLSEQLKRSSDESLQKLYKALLSVESFDAGFKGLTTGELDYFIADTRSLKYMAAISGFCKMNTVEVTELRFPIAIAFRKDIAGWKQQIKDGLIKMIESGVYDEINRKYATRSTCRPTKRFFMLGVAEFKSLFICLLVGILFSVFVWLLVSMLRRFKASQTDDCDVTTEHNDEASTYF
eukprot:gene1419-1571_t